MSSVEMLIVVNIFLALSMLWRASKFEKVGRTVILIIYIILMLGLNVTGIYGIIEERANGGYSIY